jgi:hypothetical protein
MPDRSSRQDPPDDWSRGSHAARRHSSDKAADGYEAGPGGSHRASFDPGTANGYGAANTEGLRPGPDSYGAGMNDPFAARPGAGPADRFGNADPFGDAGAFRDAGSSGDPGSFGDPGSYADGPSGSAFGTGTADAGAGQPDSQPDTAEFSAALTGEAGEGMGFLSALFDFGFTSFVTPKVIKVLYILITIGTVVSALVFTIVAFKASVAFGVATLAVGDPLFVLIVLAIYRVILEFFVVTFRVAEDVRALRERGDVR